MTALKPALAVAIYRTIEKHQPCTIAKIAQELNMSYHRVHAALPAVANNGLLLTEDDDGKLYTLYPHHGAIPCLSTKIRPFFISSAQDQISSSPPETESRSTHPT